MDVAQVLAEAPMPAAVPAGAEERKRRARVAEALIAQNLTAEPVGHWTQGLSRVANVLAGTMDEQRLDRDERAQQQRLAALLASDPRLGGPGASPEVSRVGASGWTASAASPTPAVAPNVGAGMEPKNAIASVESGGRYDALGPVIPKTGDRAHGKYQVMGANIPEWTLKHVGRQMTPQEFLASPEAQEAVFKGQFGGYEAKYGPEGAARAWFAGERGMNDLTRRDPLGTTVADYSRKFASLTPPTASPAAAAPPSGVPASVTAAFQPAVASAAAPPDATISTPAPVSSRVAPPGPAQPVVDGRTSAVIPPQIATYVRALQTSGNPQAIALATGILAQYSKPIEPKFAKFDEGTILDERTGRVTPVAAAGFKPLVDPAERLAHGIPPEDKRPYQIGPGNKLINPPAETRVTVDQRGESEFAKNAGKLTADRFNDYIKAGDDAKALIADLNYIREIGGRVTTGKTAEIKAALGPYAEAVGITKGFEELSDLQAYNAIVAKLQPRMRVAGSGATSDYEMQQFLRALPSLGKTAEGNAIIANTFDAMQQHRLKVAEIATQAMAGDLPAREAEKQIRALPDPMELWRKQRGSSPAASQKTTTGVTWTVE